MDGRPPELDTDNGTSNSSGGRPSVERTAATDAVAERAPADGESPEQPPYDPPGEDWR